ncbi:MAG: PAS domain-containing protein [Phycisphaerales bacterium]|nr:PAS domain-containing protein [Phycisphaerales bacterium]
MTDRTISEEQRQRIQERFAAVIRATTDVVWVTSPLGEVSEPIEGWEELTGQSFEHYKGMKWLQALHPDDRDRYIKCWSESVKSAKPFECEYRLGSRGGWRTMQVRCVPVLDESGVIREWMGAHTDVTERRRAEAEVLQAKVLLEQAQEVAHVGSWVSALLAPGDSGWWSAETYRIFGLPPGDGHVTADSFLHRVHPDDVGFVPAALDASVRTGQPYRARYRIIRPSGEVRCLYEQGDLQRNAEGVPTKLLGVVQDITDQRRAEDFREASARVLEMLATDRPLEEVLSALVLATERQSEGLLGSILLIDKDGRYLRHGAAPSLPREYLRIVEDAEVGPAVGSCGAAIFHNRLVIVEDILTDPLWSDYRDAAHRFGLRACWSRPITTSDGRVVGAFGMYYRTPRSPVEAELKLIGTAAHLAGIAIERRRNEQSLRQSEERLQIMTRATNDAIYDWDIATSSLWWNHGITTVFGYRECDVGKDLAWWETQVHQDDLGRVTAELAAAVEGGGQSWTSEYRFRRSDGRYADVLDRGFLLRASSGRATRMIGSMQDITERKLTERRQRLLMQELDHRVKNTLAAVMSISENTVATSDSPQEFARAFSGRIQALARTHEALARSRWTGVDLGETVLHTLTPYTANGAPSHTIQGHNLILPARAAAPVCMALHELATNAMKYGSLSVPTGNVAVSWEIGPGPSRSGEKGEPLAPADSSRWLRLRWVESGGPPVTPPTKRGFGMSIAEGMITYELRGVVDFEFPPAGLVCNLLIPLEHGASRSAANPQIT